MNTKPRQGKARQGKARQGKPSQSQAKPKPSEHDDTTSTKNRDGREGGERGMNKKPKAKLSQSQAKAKPKPKLSQSEAKPSRRNTTTQRRRGIAKGEREERGG